MQGQPIVVYYESKKRKYRLPIIYIILGVVGFFFTSHLTSYLNPFFYLLWIGLISLFYVFFYRPPFFNIYEDRLLYKKGNYVIESPWKDIISVNYGYSAYLGGGRAGSFWKFFLVTKKGTTGRIDQRDIKIVGGSESSSKFQELFNLLKERSTEAKIVNGFEVGLAKMGKAMKWFIVLIILILLIGFGALFALNYFVPA